MTRRRSIAGIHAVRTALRHRARALKNVRYDPARRDRRLGQLLAELREAGIYPQ
ncbi:MAG TPA: 23S rRNA (guanosine(2251)-2'-O)-methyltransferase RlmB, partial [Chromatiaceae bacterium]|nr:23S rRNA (guanosine(2251)-2'-O)-methyltransferase RlmB [Chromatiaceae bacterium]